MSEELTTTETEPKLQKNVISYSPVFPILTGAVLLDLPIDDMVEDVIGLVGDQKNCPGGYCSLYSELNIDNLRGVKEMKEAIYGVSCAFGRELKFEDDYDKSAIQLWVNVLRRDNYQTIRSHQRGVFSGLIAIRTDNKMSPILFKNPSFDQRSHEPFVRPQDLSPFTADTMSIIPEVGALNIWPSWLQYSQPEMVESGPQISFGFTIDFLPPGV